MILLVENDAVRCASFAETLRSYGYAVLEANDGLQALALITKHQPDIQVVITDVAQPKVNEHTLAENLRLLLPNVPIIGVSAHRSKTGGEKPITPATLVSVVQHYLASRQIR